VKRTPSLPTALGVRLGATFFLIGEAAPFAPATWTSLAVVPLLYPFMAWPLWVQIVLLAAVTGYAVVVSDRAEKTYGHDAKAITIDEVAGMLVTMLGVSVAGDAAARWVALGIGFVLFRIFDIVKPFPAGRAQRLPGGQGIVVDDLLAGIYANLVLRIVLRVI
jgi:phosphatidylglycerophosphatase A